MFQFLISYQSPHTKRSTGLKGLVFGSPCQSGDHVGPCQTGGHVGQWLSCSVVEGPHIEGLLKAVCVWVCCPFSALRVVLRQRKTPVIAGWSVRSEWMLMSNIQSRIITQHNQYSINNIQYQWYVIRSSLVQMCSRCVCVFACLTVCVCVCVRKCSMCVSVCVRIKQTKPLWVSLCASEGTVMIVCVCGHLCWCMCVFVGVHILNQSFNSRKKKKQQHCLNKQKKPTQ